MEIGVESIDEILFLSNVWIFVKEKAIIVLK